MLLQKENIDSKVNIKSYNQGTITTNMGIFNDPVLLINGVKVNFNGSQSFESLTFEDLVDYLKDKPELLIIGTGRLHQNISPKIAQQINALGVAVEAMASRQACHTYQVLIFDQRIVHTLIYP